MTERRQQWTWSEERKTERLPAVRVAPSERLRLVEAAESLGIGETELIRRALAEGLKVLGKPA